MNGKEGAFAFLGATRRLCGRLSACSQGKETPSPRRHGKEVGQHRTIRQTPATSPRERHEQHVRSKPGVTGTRTGERADRLVLASLAIGSPSGSVNHGATAMRRAGMPRARWAVTGPHLTRLLLVQVPSRGPHPSVERGDTPGRLVALDTAAGFTR